MKEYQTVIARLTRHVRDDEDALTDLLNERSRAGWSPSMLSQDGDRLVVIFERETPSGDAAETSTPSSGAPAIEPPATE